MPGKRPRPFLRTSSRPQLLQSCGHQNPPLSSTTGVKNAMRAPQRVVVGFDVGGADNNTKRHFDPCESPRSVLELDALSDHHHLHRPPPASAAPSPRSVLDRLLTAPDSRPPCKEGVGLGIVAALRREEPAVVVKPTLDKTVGGGTIYAISEQISIVYPQKGGFREADHPSTPARYCATSVSSDVDFNDDEEDEDNKLAASVPGSIFCAASPFAHCCSLDSQAGDFLSICFFCKCCLMPGKDIFMYRGDKAFCSAECRYQQIVIDELKERHSAAASNCYHAPSPYSIKLAKTVPSGLS